MTSVSHSQSAEPTPSVTGTVDRRKLYRFAGWGAALSGVCYFLQPILVAVMEATSSGPENVFLSPTEIADVFWQGPVEGAVFTGVGIGLLAAVLGVGRLVRTGAGTLRRGGRGARPGDRRRLRVAPAGRAQHRPLQLGGARHGRDRGGRADHAGGTSYGQRRDRGYSL